MANSHFNLADEIEEVLILLEDYPLDDESTEDESESDETQRSVNWLAAGHPLYDRVTQHLQPCCRLTRTGEQRLPQPYRASWRTLIWISRDKIPGDLNEAATGFQTKLQAWQDAVRAARPACEKAEPASKRKRGRPPASDKTRLNDEQIALAWDRAHKAKTLQKDFAKDKGIPLATLQRIIDRVNKRNRRSDK